MNLRNGRKLNDDDFNCFNLDANFDINIGFLINILVVVKKVI